MVRLQSWKLRNMVFRFLTFIFRPTLTRVLILIYGSNRTVQSLTICQWYFHQDNAPVHNSLLVTDYLTKMGIKTFPQPLYSLDLAPCDFWLFPKLRGCRYETIEEIKEAVTKVIDTLTQEDFHGPCRSCWNGTTSALQPEEIISKGTRVSCVYYQ